MCHRHIGLCGVRGELQIFLNSISHWTRSSPIPRAADGQCPGMQPCPPPGAGVRRLCCRNSFTCLGRSKLRSPSLYEYFTDWRLSTFSSLPHFYQKVGPVNHKSVGANTLSISSPVLLIIKYVSACVPGLTLNSISSGRLVLFSCPHGGNLYRQPVFGA